MLRDLVVTITGAPGDRQALATAIDLASRHRAHLSVLLTVALALPPGFEWGALPADLYARMHELERERGARTAAWVRDALRQHGQDADVRVVEMVAVPPGRMAALHARHADLAVVAAPGEDGSEEVLLELLFGSGRPTLVVPGGGREAPRTGHAVIAWRPTREAARAVHDALPLLEAAGSAEVVVVDPQVGELQHGELPGADIAAHLARHGLRVTTTQLPRAGESTGRCIVRHLVESGADLLVAGAYGHARWRELVLGGVTRELLATCPVPMLFSH